MNYGQLRDILTDGNIVALIMVSNVSKEIQGIMFVLCLGDANSNYKSEVEIPSDVKEKYGRLLELLPDESKFCSCSQKKIFKGFLGFDSVQSMKDNLFM